MSFTSLVFLIFLFFFLVLYYSLPEKCQLHILFMGNILFYLSGGLTSFLFLSTTVVTVFFSAKKIGLLEKKRQEAFSKIKDKSEKKAIKVFYKKKQKKCLIFCFVINFGILFTLKYFNFVMENLNQLLSHTTWNRQFVLLDVLLPLGLSFYTFQSISYLLDVYWGKEESQENFLKYVVYATFFPQMIQGPISRYGKVKDSFYKPHPFEGAVFYEGSLRILYGYFKKSVVADRLLPIIGQLVAQPDDYQGIYFLITMFLYAIALYGDFTGGIDITLGVAKLFGITLQENFNRPYLSRSITEYWRRWHMSMGSWFRDYLFYPLSVSKFMLKVSKVSREKLGKNLGKRIPFYLSTLTIWFSTGLWHGATWNYIAWGLANGFVILISQELSPFYQKFHVKFPHMAQCKTFVAFTIVRTFWLMCFIRAFDCYASVGITLQMYKSVFFHLSLEQFFSEGLSTLQIQPIRWISGIFGVSVMLFIGAITSEEKNFTTFVGEKSLIVKVSVVYFFLFSIFLLGAYGMGYDGAQFIYNQF